MIATTIFIGRGPRKRSTERRSPDDDSSPSGFRHLVSSGSIFDVRLDDGSFQAVLEQRTQTLTHEFGIAATEAETVALHGRDEWVHGPEVWRRRSRSGLTQLGPRAHQLGRVGSFHNDGEAL